ncbi:MAG: hypothetical protein ACJAY7_000849 [Pseudohongiellaceae bacterium]|jgi:hypothetical protein
MKVIELLPEEAHPHANIGDTMKAIHALMRVA